MDWKSTSASGSGSEIRYIFTLWVIFTRVPIWNRLKWVGFMLMARLLLLLLEEEGEGEGEEKGEERRQVGRREQRERTRQACAKEGSIGETST
jgi:hypothetical protein